MIWLMVHIVVILLSIGQALPWWAIFVSLALCFFDVGWGRDLNARAREQQERIRRKIERDGNG
jgi:hypothetical protein